MSNGNHFLPGVPLAATASFTGTDVDTATAALRLAASRGLLFIGANPPTVTDSPDWQRLLWAQPYIDNGATKYTLKMYNSGDSQWYAALTALPDLYLSSIKAVAADVGKVPVVTFDGLNYTPTWTTFVPSNLPATALTPASANQIIATNSAGTACYWTSLSNLLSAVGRVVTLDNLVVGAATSGQVPTFTGGTIKWQTPYSASTPIADNLAWTASNNNLEVWDTQNSKTVLKSRKQFVDTIPTDISAGAIVGSTKLLGFDVSGVSPVGITTTVSSVNDFVVANVNSLIDSKIAKFTGNLVDISIDTNTFNNGSAAALFTGIAHNLGKIPTIFGAKIIVKTAGLLNPAVGVCTDSRDIIFTDDTSGASTKNYYSLAVRADASKLYLVQSSANGVAASGASAAYLKQIFYCNSTLVQQIQLYATL